MNQVIVESVQNVVWQPQPGPQTRFCASSIFEVFYGGAAGGGKSDGLLMEGTRQVHIPQYRGIIFRRKTKQLSRLIDRSLELFPRAFPGAEWKDGKKLWVFPSGAQYMLWHMEEEKHKYDHDGQEYQYIGFDELTHFTETQYRYLYSRCRTSTPGLRCYVRGSGMPMGVGIAWVKNRFIAHGAFNIVTDEETSLKRTFIPSRLEDNPALTKTDPQYEQRLRLMGPKLYKALREGNWDVIEGAAFEELDSHHELIPHEPPKGAYIFRALDWGYAKPFSVGWYYEDYDGRIVRFKEWYGCEQGQVDKGIRMDSRKVARGIKAIDAIYNCSYGVADPSCWSKTDGSPSVAENMLAEGVHWEPAVNDRIQGKMELHGRLRSDEGGKPNFFVTADCKHWWRTVPMLQSDERKPEDVDTKMEDHPYDETRYALMDRPLRTGPQVVAVGSDLKTIGDNW